MRQRAKDYRAREELWEDIDEKEGANVHIEKV